MDAPVIKKEMLEPLAETRFLNTYSIHYDEGKEYFISSRRKMDNLTALKSLEEIDNMFPDAVTCIIIIHSSGREDRLLMQYEYRFPIGQYVLCPPAGIIDPADMECDDPLIETSKREIFEETGLRLGENDRLSVINSLAFSTPGFTDECNAFVQADIYLDNPEDYLNHSACEDTECFGDFVLLTRAEARELIKKGCDTKGHRCPLYALTTMQYFLLMDELK